MSIITYDGATCSVNVPQEISDGKTYIASTAYSADLNPIVHTYVTSVGTGRYEERKKEKTVKEVYDSLDEDQKKLLYMLVSKAMDGITFTAEQGTYSQEEELKKSLLKDVINSIYGINSTKNNDKGEITMPTGLMSGTIKYSLIRETLIFNADGSIKKVVFSGPATIVIWKDGTKTVVKCMEGDDYDPEKGLMMCIMEKLLGGKSAVKKLFKKHIPEEDTASIIEAVSHALDELKYSFPKLNLPTDHEEENKE